MAVLSETAPIRFINRPGVLHVYGKS